MEQRKREKSLKVQLKDAIKMLETLEKKNAADTVIKAQKDEINRLEREVEQSKSNFKIISKTFIDIPMNFEIHNGQENGCKNVEKRIALVKNNRPIDRKKVDAFMALFSKGKYEKAYPIIVMKADILLKAGYTVTDVNGNKITEDTDDYIVILDGQHRAIALMQLASTGKDNQIPNVHLKNMDAENVGEYLVDINNIGTSWTTKDRMVVAALTNQEELFENIAERIREGFNPSTAAMIYTKKKITSTLLNKILKGDKYELPKGADLNIERGNRFINTCKKAGMEVKRITNRYYIGGFNAFATARSDEEAFEALNHLVGKLNDEMFKKVSSEEDFNKILKETLESKRSENQELETCNEETIEEVA